MEDKKFNEAFGQRVKNRREELGLTQEELAHKIGYKNRSTVSGIEAADTWTDDIINLLRDLNEDCELGLNEDDYETPGDFATAISKMTGLELGI